MKSSIAHRKDGRETCRDRQTINEIWRFDHTKTRIWHAGQFLLRTAKIGEGSLTDELFKNPGGICGVVEDILTKDYGEQATCMA